MNADVVFVYDQRDKALDWYASAYKPVFDSHVDPILKHLPSGRKSETPVEGAVNVRFFRFMDDKAGVFMSHGIADKNWRTPQKISGFDFIATSGPYWTRYYADRGVARSRIVEVGYPKLDPLFNGDIPLYPAFRWGSPNVKPKVLWAPTHAGRSGAYPTSYRPGFKALLAGLPFDIVEAPHPRNRTEKRSTLHELADCDVVIADAGSTIYEAWAVGKPVVFPSWLIADRVRNRWPRSLEDRIYTKQVGYHSWSPDELKDRLFEAASRGIGGRERELAADVFPPDLRGRSGEVAAELLAGLPPRLEVKTPALFRCDRYPRLQINADGKWVKFINGKYKARDPEVARALALSNSHVYLDGSPPLLPRGASHPTPTNRADPSTSVQPNRGIVELASAEPKAG